MKKLLLCILLIALTVSFSGCGLLKGTPFERWGTKIGGVFERASGQGPEKVVEKFYSFINGKNYKEAQKLFVEKSQEFYNPDYIKNTNPSFGKIEITTVSEEKKETKVFFNIDKDRFLMAILVKEGGQWQLREIQDDPSQVID